MDRTPAGERRWLGRYEILRRIGAGGMGEVYLARATGIEGFEKIVVLKRLLPELGSSDPTFLRMFLDEARLAAGLSHPNIAHVYDIGCEDGEYFFAMEYVHGEDLRAVMRRTAQLARPVPIDRAVGVVIAAAEGLHHAHEHTDASGEPQRIVHRDVSPSNLLLSYDGGVKVVDFGVAKAIGHEGRTRAGSIKGKIPYMSPEQVRREALDRTTDVFSLGVILWELLAGDFLFPHLDGEACREAVLHHPIGPPSSRRAELAPELDRIVLCALARDRAARYPTAQALQLALEEHARERRLVLSSVAQARWMEELFPEKVDAWKRASSSGVTLLEHVVQTISLEPDPPSGPDAVSPLAFAPTVAFTPSRPAEAVSRAESSAAAAPRHWPVGLLAALALVAVAITVGIAFLPGPSPSPAPTKAPPSPRVETLPAPPPPPAPPAAPPPALVEPEPERPRRRPGAKKPAQAERARKIDSNSPVPW